MEPTKQKILEIRPTENGFIVHEPSIFSGGVGEKSAAYSFESAASMIEHLKKVYSVKDDPGRPGLAWGGWGWLSFEPTVSAGAAMRCFSFGPGGTVSWWEK